MKALSLPFLALFFALAPPPLLAQDATCSGKNLVVELQRDDPQALAGIREKAAQTENGEGLLWKIERAGAAPSFLFGTMHVTDPRVLALPPAADEALDAADRLVIETTDALSQNRMMAVLAKRPDLMMFTDATTLMSLLAPEQRKTVENGLQARGIGLASVNKMKPWILAAMLASSPCELARQAKGAIVLDATLADKASGANKDVLGLETGIEQLEAMAKLPMSFHLQSLVDTVALGDGINDVNETMIALYKEGEIALLWPLLDHVMPDPDGQGYAQFEQVLITQRNHVMAERAQPILAQGGAFMAVGALHLPGKEGLVSLLRNSGFTVTQVVR
ncbi:TraB/GumN family protein [Tianweitania sp. BSSL-BM11]|uniref:TraB/GumN family protein n=1 Tax=Tianweitania aestuarii TaxID=2814886 RepID=A0ABS5RZ11_9HYPH|nr:TraB/GumN family protein [Tianweitania aestuarii]MBS9722263.1 TraB/GumN family protein [Tianweitania aestuarii]